MWRCAARAAGPQHPWLSVLRRRALVQRTTEESSPRSMNTYFETTARLRSLMQTRMSTWGVYARMSCWNETTGLESPQSTRSSHTRNHTDSQYLHTCVGLCCSALLHAAGTQIVRRLSDFQPKLLQLGSAVGWHGNRNEDKYTRLYVVHESLAVIVPESRACRRPEASRTTPSLVSQWGPVCCGGSRQCLEAEAVGARVPYIYRQGCLQLGLLTRQSWEWIIRNACTQQAEAGQQLAAALTTPPGLDRVDT